MHDIFNPGERRNIPSQTSGDDLFNIRDNHGESSVEDRKGCPPYRWGPDKEGTEPRLSAQGDGSRGQFPGTQEAGGRPQKVDHVDRGIHPVQIFSQAIRGGCEGLESSLNDRTSRPQEVRKPRRTSGGLLGSPIGNRKSGKAGLSFPSNAGKSDGLPIPSTGTKGGDLRDRIGRLENEMLTAERECQIARVISDPFSGAFWSAHGHLEALHARRRSGTVVTKKAMVAACDARVAAGHEWNPSKTKLQEAERWLRRIKTELKAANAELGS